MLLCLNSRRRDLPNGCYPDSDLHVCLLRQTTQDSVDHHARPPLSQTWTRGSSRKHERRVSVQGTYESKGFQVTWLRDFKLPKGFKNEKEIMKAQTKENNFLREQLDSSDPMYASKKNIQSTIIKMVKAQRPGDLFFFRHSGHGGQIKDTDGDEVDGRDERVCTADWNPNGKFDANNLSCSRADMYIIDDWFREQFLQLKCESFFLIEACHSGTMLDLDYDYKDGTMVHTPKRASSPPNRPRCVLLSPVRDSQCGKQIFPDEGEKYFPGLKAGEKADVFTGSVLSLALKLVLEKNPNISIGELLRESRRYIAERLGFKKSVPCLSASYELDLDTPYAQLAFGEQPL